MKKALAQLVIAMAHHGYLELEGGQEMIEFIVRQSSLLPDPQVCYLLSAELFGAPGMG